MFTFQNLTDKARQHMVDELDRDIQWGGLYLSERFTERGRADYPSLMREAMKSHDERWLANQLVIGDRMKTMEMQQYKTGLKPKKVPSNAPSIFADGEFNRFYCRAVCLLALEAGEEEMVEIYRAKASQVPRPDSQAKIGRKIKAKELLDDLRANKGVDTSLGVPAGVGSGLSVKLVS